MDNDNDNDNEDQSKTVRQKIIALIRERPRDALSLSKELKVSQRQIEDHLQHVALSINAKSSSGHELFIIIPAKCWDCDFKFRERNRMTKPSRCPKCKGEQISLPAYEITQEKK